MVVIFEGCGDEGRQENVKLSNATKIGMFRAGSINFDNLNTSAKKPYEFVFLHIYNCTLHSAMM